MAKKKAALSHARRVEVLTGRHGPDRAGANLEEADLNPANVDVRTFGKLFGRPVDGDLYAQPLIANNLTIAGRRHGSVVFLATSRNTVYAYDAEDPDESLPLWETNLGAIFSPPRLPVPRDAIFPGYLNFASEVGITSTPVIDRDARGKGGTIYVVSKTISGPGPRRRRPDFAHHIHALDILTGRPDPAVGGGQPAPIEAMAVSHTKAVARFDPRRHLNRPALLLLDGVLYLAFGSHGDEGTFWGWVMAYDARTLAKLAVHCTAIDWGEGGIWQSGNGLAGETTRMPDGSTHHHVYAVVGNGQRPIPEAAPGQIPAARPAIPTVISEPFYGNCILKLELVPSEGQIVGDRPPTQGEPGTPLRFEIVDWFTTSDCLDLNNLDDDLISGPVIFEVTQPSGTRVPMVLGGGKDGRFYLADRTNLGKWNSMTGPPGSPPAHVGAVMVKDPKTGLDTTTPVPFKDPKTGKPVIDPKTGLPATIPEWKPWPPGSVRNNAILQDDRLCAFHIHGTPAIWQRSESDVTAFVWSENDFLKAYAFDPAARKFATPPHSTSQYRLPPFELRMPGGSLAVSSDGGRPGTGVVWASHSTDDNAMNKTVKGTLRAFNAEDLNDQLWTSDTEAGGADRLGSLAKFCPPVVANGKVYMATFSRELVVYGLLPRPRKGDCEDFETRGFGPGVQGSCTFSCARYNLSASGQGLAAGATSDSFYFAYREVDADRAGVSLEITARVLGFRSSPALTNACAGVMIRSAGGAPGSPDPEMPFAAMLVTPKDGALFLARGARGDPSHRDGQTAIEIPHYLRLTAISSVGQPGELEFTGSVSADGHNWTVLSSRAVIPMQGLVRIGLVGTAKAEGVVDQATDHITVSFGGVTVAP